jgi:putative membrane protein
MSAHVKDSEEYSRLPEWIGLLVLFVFTASAILGYWTFGLHPNLIPDNDFARNFYGLSFKLFARGQILVAGVVLAIKLYRHSDFRWLAGFAAVALISFLSEHVGTGYGFPFGGYEYTGLLGYKVGGRVPFVIPISWFLMALPSWVLASIVFPGRGAGLPRVFMAAYLLTAWDLALDPAMSYLTPYWIWENPGPFYGMPWVNLAGWMGTSLVLMVALELLNARSWTARLDVRWVLAYYLTVLFMPVGMLAASGLWLAILVTGLALLIPLGVVILSMNARRSSEPMALARESAG